MTTRPHPSRHVSPSGPTVALIVSGSLAVLLAVALLAVGALVGVARDAAR